MKSQLPLTKKEAISSKEPDPYLNWKRYSSLVFLAVQNAVLVLLGRYSRTAPGEKYISTTAVVSQEAVKLICSAVIILVNEGGIRGLFSQLNENILKAPGDTLRVSVPAILYIVLNNMFYIALSNLPAATFQVLYQSKLLTTAMFAVLMLSQRFSVTKWFSLLMLAVGVAAVQIETTVAKNEKLISSDEQNPILGFSAVIVASLTSGFAGIYFEKILKNSDVSVWIRNIQLALFGVSIGLVTVFVNDGAEVYELGFFHGYNKYTVALILTQAVGGLIVACVVKYADNILKGFATSISIIISCIVSMFIFSFNITPVFVTGTCLVVGATFIYGKAK
ncbi:UDP-galactose translocator-like [Symsagittifera roscoffensis]|uniref:UDP-galactose translocator-like n=1 Tax=Symsagittifera roscoffensis TaxID=84072 RepID=UPI00307B1558